MALRTTKIAGRKRPVSTIIVTHEFGHQGAGRANWESKGLTYMQPRSLKPSFSLPLVNDPQHVLIGQGYMIEVHRWFVDRSIDRYVPDQNNLINALAD